MYVAHMAAVIAALGFSVLSINASAGESASYSVKSRELESAIKKETYKKITSVLVSKDGQLVYESYWGEGGADYLNDTRSAMKSLTAMTLGAAVADGFIKSVDEPAFVWFEDEQPVRFPTQLKQKITIRDLLTMSSALDCNDNEWESPGNEEHMYPARKWLYFVLDMPTKDDYGRNENGYGPFSYCTAGSFLLGQIIERAVGEPVDAYVARRILAPLGIERITWDKSPSQEVMTGGGAELASRDLMKLGELVRNDGVFEGERILPASWIAEMTRVQVKASEEQDYGYQWWREDFSCGKENVSGWYMAGNGGNKIAIFDELGLTVVVTAQLYGTKGMHQQSKDIIENYVLAAHPACAVAGR